MLQRARVKIANASGGKKKEHRPSVSLVSLSLSCIIHRGTNDRRIADDKPFYLSNFYARLFPTVEGGKRKYTENYNSYVVMRCSLEGSTSSSKSLVTIQQRLFVVLRNLTEPI